MSLVDDESRKLRKNLHAHKTEWNFEKAGKFLVQWINFDWPLYGTFKNSIKSWHFECSDKLRFEPVAQFPLTDCMVQMFKCSNLPLEYEWPLFRFVLSFLAFSLLFSIRSWISYHIFKNLRHFKFVPVIFEYSKTQNGGFKNLRKKLIIGLQVLN